MSRQVRSLPTSATHFSLITEPSKVRGLWMEGIDRDAEVRLWIKKADGGEPELPEDKFFAGIISQGKFQDGVTLKFKNAADAEKVWKECHKDILEGNPTKEIVGALYLSKEKVYGFSTRALKIMGDLMHCEAPSRLIRIQRRASVRYSIPRGYEVFVHLGKNEDELKSYRLLDVSVGGAAFFVPHADGDHFEKGAFYERVEMRIQKRLIPAQGEVLGRVSMMDRDEGAGFKVRMRCVFGEADSEYLELYILDHMVQYSDI